MTFAERRDRAHLPKPTQLLYPLPRQSHFGIFTKSLLRWQPQNDSQPTRSTEKLTVYFIFSIERIKFHKQQHRGTQLFEQTTSASRGERGEDKRKVPQRALRVQRSDLRVWYAAQNSTYHDNVSSRDSQRISSFSNVMVCNGKLAF